MKSLRLTIALMALTSLPFGAIAAQGRGKDKPRAQSESECKPEHRAALERARAEGREAPPGLAAKCPDAPPPPPPPSNDPPPSGPHVAKGVVYEDVDGDGIMAPTAGEFGLAGWTVQLLWNGRVVSSVASNDDGNYEFPGLGNSSAWAVCVVPQAGYALTEAGNRQACGGNGSTFALVSSFMTWNVQNFGGMIQ
jgi:hypothetical protein